MAPSQAEWDALTDEERAQVVAELPGEVTDAEMTPPEGDRHFRAKVRALDALRTYFERHKRSVYLSAELPVYYPQTLRFAPDLLAVVDVGNQERDKWVVGAEKRGLDWVLEVHVGGDRKKEAERNVVRYALLGIPEYFIYDRANNRLFAYRLAEAGARVYTPIVPHHGAYASAILGLEVQLESDRLRFFVGNAILLESEELVTRLEAMVDQVHRRADEEQRRADEERERADEEQRRADDEARLRKTAEDEVARLKLQIERLTNR